MSKTAAAADSRCRLPAGGFRTVLAILVFLPSAVLATNSEPALRRSNQVDVSRLGKLSEDERSVLRIEWRAGMAGVEETRRVEDMLDKLRRLETGINIVNHLVRNMPVQAPAVATVVPVAPEAPASQGFDQRLAFANAAALALVALWWFHRRKKPATLLAASSPSAPAKAPPGASLRAEAPPIAPLPVATATTLPVAPAPPDPVSALVASLEPVAAPAPAPAEPVPAEPFPANETMIFDFSLEEADPETVAREHAKQQALRPASPPKTPPAAPAAHKADVEPTLQLAEIMLSMGLEQGAAQALIEYTEANPRHAIYHWLKLLGIYRSRGLQHEFAMTAEKLRLYFNIQAAEWGQLRASEAPTLENFSRVAEHVQKIWAQTEECTAYLRRLLEDNRDGSRAGFPQSVAEEILFLVEVQKELAGRSQPAA